MSSSSLKEALAGASRLAANESLRKKNSREETEEIEDPGEADERPDLGDSMEVWRLLPHLRDLPEAMIKKLPLSAMFQLNSALAKDVKNSAKLNINTRLAANAQKLVTRPIKVEAGIDNRRDVLHPARYMGGASCAAPELWLGARRHLGEEAVTALGNYDLDSLGCGGSVTPRGWQEIHNPGSQELKLKLFHLPNVAGSNLSAKKVCLDGGEESVSIGDSMREISDMEGFKMALHTAREAMQSALPWNRSISAISGFMMNTGYLQQDLGGNNRRAAILTEFTDYVLGRNALNWENGQPFLTADEMAHVWQNWKGKRAALFITKQEDKKPEKADGFKRERRPTDVCRMYNLTKCRQQNDKECKTTWGKTLRHVCNKYMAGGKLCEKDHTRADHK